jgi:hypothetical protein
MNTANEGYGHALRLYHFTELRALIGDAGLAAIRPSVVDLATVAARGSIIACGLKPFSRATPEDKDLGGLCDCALRLADADQTSIG